MIVQKLIQSVSELNAEHWTLNHALINPFIAWWLVYVPGITWKPWLLSTKGSHMFSTILTIAICLYKALTNCSFEWEHSVLCEVSILYFKGLGVTAQLQRRPLKALDTAQALIFVLFLKQDLAIRARQRGAQVRAQHLAMPLLHRVPKD